MFWSFRIPSLVLLVLVFGAPIASAHTIFKKELQTRYDFKIVSCFACHARKTEVETEHQEAYKENAKSFRNEFGKEFEKLLKGKNLSAKIKEAMDSGDAEKKSAVEKEALKAFNEALEKVVEVETPRGKTYGEELKSGTLSGVTKK